MLEDSTQRSEQDSTSNKGLVATNEAGSWNASPNLEPMKLKQVIKRSHVQNSSPNKYDHSCKPMATGWCLQGGLNTVSSEFPSFNEGTCPALGKSEIHCVLVKYLQIYCGISQRYTLYAKHDVMLALYLRKNCYISFFFFDKPWKSLIRRMSF